MTKIPIKILSLLESKKISISLCVLMVLGLIVGGTFNLSWNDLIENSAFKAGLINYKVKTPQFYFQTRLQSIFYFIFEILFRIGLDELALAKVSSALLGGISYFTLGFISLTIYRSYWSIPLVIIVDYFWLYDFGVNYNVAISYSNNPQGHIGLIICLFFLVYHNFKKYKLSYCLIGLSPIFHITLGFWVNLAVLVVELYRKNYKDYKNTVVPYLIGILLTIVFYVLLSDTNLLNSLVYTAPKFTDYLKNWDLHQQYFDLSNLGLWLSLLITFVLIRTEKREDNDLKYYFLIFFVTATIHGFYSHLVIDYIPGVFWTLMPSRLLNFSILYLSIFILTKGIKEKGLVGSIIIGMFTCLFFYVIWFGRDNVRYFKQLETFLRLVFVIDIISVFFILFKEKVRFFAIEIRKLNIIKHIALFMVLLLILFDYSKTMKMAYLTNLSELKYYKNDRLLEKINNEGTLLLTAPSIKQFQLISRVPIIFEMDTIDDLLYNSVHIQISAKYLDDLYGINFYHPQKEFKNNIPLIDEWVKSVWESRSPEDWGILARDYQISHIVVPSSWKLNLTVMDKNKIWNIYKI